MKFGLAVLLTLALGSVASHFLLEDNGYVLINFRGYSVEMSVPVLVVALCLLYIAARLLVRTWQAPRELGAAAARARARRSGRSATEGLIALSEGKLARGERLLTRSAGDSGAPLLNYLSAARAAQMQGDRGRRDEWLRLAAEQDPAATNAVLLTRAELELAHGERGAALQSLARVLEDQPRHPEALRMLARLRREGREWRELADLLPALRRVQGLSGAELESWTVEAWTGLLDAPGLDHGAIEGLWGELPRALRKRPELVRARAGALVRGGYRAEAETEIRRALKRDWDPALVGLYGQVELGDGSRQLAQLEAWLKDHPDDPVLLLAAGRACLRAELWGKARSYLESSLAVEPTPAAYHALGELMREIGDTDEASEAFRKGLDLSYGPTTRLPRLGSDL